MLIGYRVKTNLLTVHIKHFEIKWESENGEKKSKSYDDKISIHI